MKGDKEVIRVLNEVLVSELTAINEYFLHARMCKKWGYEKIASTMREESICEMKHASDLADRILFIDGLPNFQDLGKISIGENVHEQLLISHKMELEAVDRLKKSIDVCQKANDHTSSDLLENILKDEENHLCWLEAQLSLIKEIGVENYLAQQM